MREREGVHGALGINICNCERNDSRRLRAVKVGTLRSFSKREIAEEGSYAPESTPELLCLQVSFRFPLSSHFRGPQNLSSLLRLPPSRLRNPYGSVFSPSRRPNFRFPPSYLLEASVFCSRPVGSVSLLRGPHTSKRNEKKSCLRFPPPLSFLSFFILRSLENLLGSFISLISRTPKTL